MSFNNNFPEQNRPADPATGWNSPSQQPGPYYPPTTVTGYNAQFPLNPVDTMGYMPPVISPDEAYRQAEKRVANKMRFYKHLTSYLSVNALLWAIALISWASSGFGSVWTLIWPIWVTMFWGIGLASDYFQTFGLNETTRQRMIEDEMRKTGRR